GFSARRGCRAASAPGAGPGEAVAADQSDPGAPLGLMFLPGLLLALQSGSLVVAPQGPLRTLGAAVAVAHPGDTIRVRAGRYHERALTIDRPLTILGDSG